MSLNQLVSPLVPLDVKVQDLTVFGQATVADLDATGDVIISGEIKSDVKVAGQVEATSFLSDLYLDAMVTMTSGAFAGQQVQIQAQNYGEFTFVDIGEFLNKTASATGPAELPAGTLPEAFAPSKHQIYCCIVQYQGSIYDGLIQINPDGSMSIEALSGASGRTLVPFTGANNGWYNTAVCYWRTQLLPGARHTPAPSGITPFRR